MVLMMWQLVAALLIASGMACAQSPTLAASGPLARRVPAYSIRNEPRLKALVRLGQENAIPLGIEFSTSELDEPVTVSTSATDVRTVITAILGRLDSTRSQVHTALCP